MESSNSGNPKNAPKTPGRLPAKPLSFANQSGQKYGKKVNSTIDKSKKGNHLLMKLTGK
jgi:hypothetical protein